MKLPHFPRPLTATPNPFSASISPSPNPFTRPSAPSAPIQAPQDPISILHYIQEQVSQTRSSPFSIQKNNNFHHDYASHQIYLSNQVIKHHIAPFSMQPGAILRKLRHSPHASTRPNYHRLMQFEDRDEIKDISNPEVPVYECRSKVLIQEEGYMDFLQNRANEERSHLSNPNHAKDRTQVQQQIHRLKAYGSALSHDSHQFHANHPLYKTHLDIMKIAPPVPISPYEEVSNDQIQMQCPPKFIPYTYIRDIKEFNSIIPTIFSQEGFDKGKEFIFALPLINEAFRDKATLASLVYNVLFNREPVVHLLQHENLSWIKYAVTFRHIMEHLPNQSDLETVHENMLRVWMAVDYQWHQLGWMRRKQYELSAPAATAASTESSTDSNSSYNPIDLITERFLYVYSNSRLSPSVDAIAILAKAYAQTGQTQKYIQLLQWMLESKIDMPQEWKLHFLKMCYASEGKHHMLSRYQSRLDCAMYIKALARGGDTQRALYVLVSKFRLGKQLHQTCLKNMDMDQSMYMKMRSNEGRSTEKKTGAHSKWSLTRNHTSMLLSLIDAVQDVDFALMLREELARMYRAKSLRDVPNNGCVSEASTAILRKYVESYDIESAERFFRETFMGNEEKAPLCVPSMVTYEWMKRGAILTSNGRWLRELESLQEQLRHVATENGTRDVRRDDDD